VAVLADEKQVAIIASIGMMMTEPPCSTMSNLVSRPSGVFRVSRRMVKARPFMRISERMSSNGMGNFPLQEI
jgi:hypothetical protein